MTVAVYGSLRKGQSNSPLLSNGTYRGSFMTKPEYVMKSLGQNSFPGVKKGGNTSIFMEVYRVSKDDLKSLDHLEGFTKKGDKNNFYEREIISTPYGKALAYFYNSDFKVSEPLVETGNWVDYKNELLIKSCPC